MPPGRYASSAFFVRAQYRLLAHHIPSLKYVLQVPVCDGLQVTYASYVEVWGHVSKARLLRTVRGHSNMDLRARVCALPPVRAREYILCLPERLARDDDQDDSIEYSYTVNGYFTSPAIYVASL